MKKFKFYLYCSMMSAVLILMPTSCGDDTDEPSPENVKQQITTQSLEGGWISPVQSSLEYGITRGDNGQVPNSKNQWKSNYKVSANYFIIFDTSSISTNGYAQYFDGLFARGSYIINYTNLIYGGQAKIVPNASSQMKANVQNLEIMSYQYKKSANLITSASMMVPAISRNEMTFSNELESKKIVECKLVPNIQGQSYRYETWEEDANGNILNYIDHGGIDNGGNNVDRFLVFTDVVYVRATDYNNKNATYGHYKLSDKSKFYQNLIWD